MCNEKLLIKPMYSFQSRILKNDLNRIGQMMMTMVLLEEENGWKIIHTDVFRFPTSSGII